MLVVSRYAGAVGGWEPGRGDVWKACWEVDMSGGMRLEAVWVRRRSMMAWRQAGLSVGDGEASRMLVRPDARLW